MSLLRVTFRHITDSNNQLTFVQRTRGMFYVLYHASRCRLGKHFFTQSPVTMEIKCKYCSKHEGMLK